MEKFVDKNLTEFSELLASSEPVPGGGGAAAYAAALGASLGCMVCALSLGKSSCAGAQEEITALQVNLEAARKYLLTQVDEDAKAFQPLRKYWAQPKDAPERAEHLEAALRIACQAPTEVMYTCGRVLEWLEPLAEIGVKGAISDVGAGAELCRGALLCAQQSIFINSASIGDKVFAMTLRRECELVREQYLPLAEKILAAVAKRVG